MSKDHYNPVHNRAAQIKRRKGARAWYEIALPGSQPLNGNGHHAARKRRPRSSTELRECTFEETLVKQEYGPDLEGLPAEEKLRLAHQKRTLGAAQGVLTYRKPDHTPPPCFFWKKCRAQAACEKQGKSMCEPCAAAITGQRFPLRAPTRAPLYHPADEAFRLVRPISA